MRVAYLSQYDARNVRNWSGTGYAMARCLEGHGFNLDYIGPLNAQKNPINIARYLINTRLLGKNDHPQRDPGFLRSYSRQAESRLRRSRADLIFAPGGLTLSYLETSLPVVMWTDATFASMVDYYPSFSRLSARTLRNGHEGERRALNRCDLVLFSSEWAAESAIRDYGVSPERVHVVPFGSNLPDDPDPREIEHLIDARLESLDRKMVLFSAGVDWHRKGIDLAQEVTDELNRRGIRTELQVAGCRPPEGERLSNNVTLLGFISKQTEQGLARLAQLYRTAHWFILPSRAECFGIAYCEASSFGLPSLARATGGVPSAVADGVNGRLFDPDATASEWADYVMATVADRSRYAELCRSAYRRYREALNWNAAGARARALIEELMASRGSHRR